jgi:hypothetical protein
VDDAFLSYVQQQQAALAPVLCFPFMLDGFPRSLAQVAKLLATARTEGWRVKIVRLGFLVGCVLIHRFGWS